MASFTGTIYDPWEWLADPVRVGVTPSTITSRDDSLDWDEMGYKFGTLTKSTVTVTPRAKKGTIYEPFAPAMLDTIYLTPETIDAKIITATTEHEVRIWNAHGVSKILSSVVGTNASGTENDLVGATPITLPAMGEKKHVVKVLKDGPPVQNTTYAYVVGLETKILKITGVRVLSFNYEPNWKNSVKIRYRFKTVIHDTEQYAEQRRPLQSSHLRSEELLISEYGNKKERLINDLNRLCTKFLAIPIYSEALLTSTSTLGVTTLNFSEDLDKLYNVQNLNYFLLMNTQDTDINELKEKQAITSSSLTFNTAITKDIENCVVYPCFFGRVESYDISAVTREYVDVKIKLLEVRI